MIRASEASSCSSTIFFSSLTRWPTSRFAEPGAALSQWSLSCVSMPFLRAIQRSRRTFESDSPDTAAISLSSADFSSRAAASSAAGEKSSSLGTVYMELAMRRCCWKRKVLLSDADVDTVEEHGLGRAAILLTITYFQHLRADCAQMQK